MRLIKDDLRRNSLLLTTAERESSEDPETITTNSQHDRCLDDVSPPILSVDDLDPTYVSHDNDLARGQFSLNAPELSPNDMILNRLMFDEGGPPSAPSFSQVCMSQPQEKTVTDVSSNRKLISRKNKPSPHKSGMSTEKENDQMIDSRADDDGFITVKKKNSKGRKSLAREY